MQIQPQNVLNSICMLQFYHNMACVTETAEHHSTTAIQAPESTLLNAESVLDCSPFGYMPGSNALLNHLIIV